MISVAEPEPEAAQKSGGSATLILIWSFNDQTFNAVLRIRMDPELLPVSGSGIKVPDPDPAKSKRAYKIVKILLFD